MLWIKRNGEKLTEIRVSGPPAPPDEKKGNISKTRPCAAVVSSDPWFDTRICSVCTLNQKKPWKTDRNPTIWSSCPSRSQNARNLDNAGGNGCRLLGFVNRQCNRLRMCFKLKETNQNSPRYEDLVLLPLPIRKWSDSRKRVTAWPSSLRILDRILLETQNVF